MSNLPHFSFVIPNKTLFRKIDSRNIDPICIKINTEYLKLNQFILSQLSQWTRKGILDVACLLKNNCKYKISRQTIKLNIQLWITNDITKK